MRQLIDPRGYVRFSGLTVLHARVHVHVLAIAAAAVLLACWIRTPELALEAVGCYFGVILLHEMGHAAMARRLGYQAPDIYLGLLHGRCELDSPDSLRDEAMVAWGGVLAQFAVALPLLALDQVPAVASWRYAGIAIGVLGYLSVFVALFNLAPIRGLDGAVAWRLVPILVRDARAGAAAKKAMRDLLRRLK